MVRDRIPELIEQSEDVKVLTKTLDDEKYGESIIEKIHEETEELALAIQEKTNPIEELADILELINAIADFIGSSFSEVEMERLKKLKVHGGFKKRLMLLGKVRKNSK